MACRLPVQLKAVSGLLLPWFPLAVWIGFWLCAVNWNKLRDVLVSKGGLLGVLLIGAIWVLIWGVVAPPESGSHYLFGLMLSNFVGKLVNFWTYNNGYHTIHHIEPGLHWSLLPGEHAKRVAPFVHPNLDQANFPAYLFRTFFWPGKRVTYLGEPLVLRAEGPDEEWIPAPSETPADVSLGAMA